MSSEDFDIKINVQSSELWKGWGKNNLTFTTLLCELIDNSISNIIAHEKQLEERDIRIKINYNSTDEKIKVSIEDTGAGINDFSQALTPG